MTRQVGNHITRRRTWLFDEAAIPKIIELMHTKPQSRVIVAARILDEAVRFNV